MIGAAEVSGNLQTITSAVMFLATAAAVYLGGRPLLELIARREQQYDLALRGGLLMNVKPRSVTVLTVLAMASMGLIGYALTESLLGTFVAAGIGMFLPAVVVKVLWRRRIAKLETQLVPGIQTLTSGVRAGLNLVQAMKLLATDGPRELRQEFAHLLREYDYGVSLEDAMDNAADRMDSGDFRLLFSALKTHRERGGDLGATLDRIAESVREIQRLENRVRSLTAQGRATARWLAAMPAVVLAILYFLVSPEDTVRLFTEDAGKLILAVIVILNIAGFLWIRKIVSINI
ncbi:MAG TPA: hypothetical protein DCX07_11060 [Phycisphaerales bacterium]|nr:hypothetical protein [Phycisphaerales bacterium]